jgi:protein-disulfide isomerase
MELHPNAIPGALAAEAAGKQGKFWEMYDLLYQNQADWGESPDAKSKFAEYAAQIGLNVDQFVQDEGDSALLDKVKQSRSNAEALGLQGTPSFFVNGKHIDNPGSYPDFRSIIEAAGGTLVATSTMMATSTGDVTGATSSSAK